MARRQIAVVGTSSSSSETDALARALGYALAQADCVVVCGGLGGVMTAVCEGVAEAGGLSVGILPGESREAANEAVGVVVATGIGHARNLAVVASGDAVIAVGGDWGTASEIALARKLGRRVVVLGGSAPLDGPGVLAAVTVEEALELALGE